MTIQEFNDFAAANGLGPDTKITFSDFSGVGEVQQYMLNPEGVDDPIFGDSRALDIDVTS